MSRNGWARRILVCSPLVALCGIGGRWLIRAAAQEQDDVTWSQWGKNPQHQGFVTTDGQAATSILADIVYDPFTSQEEAVSGDSLLVHYQVPLIDTDNNVYMEFKTGSFTGNNTWNTQIWNEKRLSWVNGSLVTIWNFESDWKPEPRRLVTETLWEPVFHGVLTGNFVYVPGLGGTIHKLDKDTGAALGRINPFSTIDPTTFVAGPLSADNVGNIYYNVSRYDRAVALPPSRAAFVDSWLVKVSSDGTVTKVRYVDLLAPANPPTICVRAFSADGVDVPWPPFPSATPTSSACGPQRAGLNIAPAIASDGTIYTASRADLNSRYAYLVAANPDLTLKWAASLRDRGINDGCGVLIPKATQANPIQKGKCAWNAPTGVDPDTNDTAAGRILDSGTASPTVLPDGSVTFGAYSRYNIARGHLFKFSSSGQFQQFFDFGWDDTLAVVPGQNNDFSIVMKDNHYDEEAGFYCNPTGTSNSTIVCASTGIPAGPFYITQVNSDLEPEWQFQSTETRSCHRNPDGSVTCVDDGTHPHGFEWCINAPAIDGQGNVYVASEDGNVYVLDQGHSGVFTTPKFKVFTNLAIGAAYTPFSIDNTGRLYAQNNGHLFVLGEVNNPQ